MVQLPNILVTCPSVGRLWLFGRPHFDAGLLRSDKRSSAPRRVPWSPEERFLVHQDRTGQSSLFNEASMLLQSFSLVQRFPPP